MSADIGGSIGNIDGACNHYGAVKAADCMNIMIQRILSFILLAWLLGFIWFALFLPQPAAPSRTDAIVVLTGGPGRIDRGLELLEARMATRMLISGVDQDVKPSELAAQYRRPASLFACCIALGFEAVDTRSNGLEVARWVARRKYTSIRLITTDWHMRRARGELGRALPADVRIISDAVRSKPDFKTLALEYHKFLLRGAGALLGI
jgi:uncharacterized SAM-binding protein YcdF (DUF218 family)